MIPLLISAVDTQPSIAVGRLHGEYRHIQPQTYHDNPVSYGSLLPKQIKGDHRILNVDVLTVIDTLNYQFQHHHDRLDSCCMRSGGGRDGIY